jgi:broad specificity phosphatase PhoE
MEHQSPDASPQIQGEPERPPKHIYLIRHGQTVFNVEGRLPGQLAGVDLTDEGKCQAHRAAVALAVSPISAVVSSPLARARETAEIIARGWGLPVRLDDRLKDTDVGAWAGQKIDDLRKHDPAWTEFVRHGNRPPPGVESLRAVLERAVAVIEDIRRDATLGEHIAVVAHADVVKLVVAHYFDIDPECIHALLVENASVTALRFKGDDHPALLALNWTPAPSWLGPTPSRPAPERDAADASPRTNPDEVTAELAPVRTAPPADGR